MGYFIRQRKSGWTLIKTYYEDGKCFGPTIPASEYSQHFFSSSMSIEEAREQAKRLNRELHTSQWMKKREVIQERLRKEAREKVVFLPDALCAAFEKELEALPDPKRLQTCWRAARKLIRTVRIPPEEWKRRSQAIYNYFEENHLIGDHAALRHSGRLRAHIVDAAEKLSRLKCVRIEAKWRSSLDICLSDLPAADRTQAEFVR